MKKIINIFLITLLVFFITNITTKVSAASDFNIVLQTNKTTYKKGEDVIVSVVLTKSPEKGINEILATLVYDSTNLQYDRIIGKNGFGSAKYNPNGGKLTLSSGDFVNSNTVIFQIIFKTLTENAENVNITLENIEATDSDKLYEQSNTSTSIKIETVNNNNNQDEEEKENNNQSNNNNQNNNQNVNDNNNNNSNVDNTDNNNDNQNNNNNINNNSNVNNNTNATNKENGKDNSLYNGEKLPQAGSNNLTIVILSIIAVILIIAIIAVSYKRGKRSR